MSGPFVVETVPCPYRFKEELEHVRSECLYMARIKKNIYIF